MVASVDLTTHHDKHVHLKINGEIELCPFEHGSHLPDLGFKTPSISNGVMRPLQAMGREAEGTNR